MAIARVARLSFLAILVVSIVTVGARIAPAAGTSTITGVAFIDLNGDGVQQPTEEPAPDHRLYLFGPDGQYLGQATTDLEGRYALTALADGRYRVEYDSSSWSPLKDEWVPSTTGTVWPRVDIDLSGSASVDFGWRPIVWSTDISAPISSHEGANGLRAESFNDAVEAREVYDAVMEGLVGDEAPFTVVRFALTETSYAGVSVVGVDGDYRNFQANLYVSYRSWLSSWDQTLSHEYGHAWSLYHAYMVQADPTIAGYLEARGLSDDDRVDSSYVWGRGELIAEDYRQLFGSPNARQREQANRDIPPAAEVEGLQQYLADVFTQPPSDEEEPEAEPSPEPDDGSDADAGEVTSTDPTPDPSPSPSSEDPEPTTLEIISASVTVTKRAATASFTVNASASATVEILDIDGTVVRRLARGLAVDADTPTHLEWDRKDQNGKRVQRGTYVLHVAVTDSSGGTDVADVGFELT